MGSQEKSLSLVPVYLGLVGLAVFISFIVWVVLSTKPARGKAPLENTKQEQPQEKPKSAAEGQGWRAPPPAAHPGPRLPAAKHA
ncbi:MAG: hypothetical protein CSA62_15420 [Planctomycetota bacterium]|nr:MAG: hypothetical protein CSA62_15420 [Planctomycetota bacterium]